MIELLYMSLKTAAVSLTIMLLLVLSCRTLFRQKFGAINAYALWILIPLLPLTRLLISCLPTEVLPSANIHWIRLDNATSGLMIPATSLNWPLIVIACWAAGTVVSLMFQILNQLAFIRKSGALIKHAQVYYSESSQIGPALVGIIRPKIILPADFDSKYTAAERNLILAHEEVHLSRGDHYANAFCALLQCLFWFHPLIHYAANRFRFDQELACDAVVISKHQTLRKTYASAMLKTQTVDVSLPVGCTWQSSQFLKVRIMTLNNQNPSAAKRHIGRGLIAVLAVCSIGFAWAEQPETESHPTKTVYDISMKLAVDGIKPSEPHVRAAAGEPFVLEVGNDTEQWRGTFVLTPVSGGSVKIAMKLNHQINNADQLVASPAILMSEGEWGKIKTTDEKTQFDLSIMAKRSTPLASN